MCELEMLGLMLMAAEQDATAAFSLAAGAERSWLLKHVNDVGNNKFHRYLNKIREIRATLIIIRCDVLGFKWSLNQTVLDIN